MEKRKNWIILELTDSLIKITHITGIQASAAVSKLAVSAVDGKSDSDISDIIAGQVTPSEARISNIIVSVPQRFVLMKHLALPSRDPTEIKKMVNLQIEQYVPYNYEDVVIDYFILEPNATDGFSKILVMVIPKSVIQRYQNLLKQAGLYSCRFIVSSWAIKKWFSQYRHQTPDASVKSVALLNIDLSHSEICFFQNDMLIFARDIDYGMQDIIQKNIAGFIEQALMTMDSYHVQQIGPRVEKVYLVGISSESKLFLDSLREKLSCPVEIINLNSFGDSHGSAVDAFVRHHPQASIVTSLGLLYGIRAGKLNLLLIEEFKQHLLTQKKRDIVELVFLITLVFIFISGIFAIRIDRKHKTLADLEAALSQINKQKNLAADRMHALELLETKLKNRLLLVDLLKELFQLTPKDISFQTVQMDQQNNLTLQGFSNSSNSINVFQEQLVQSASFKDATLQYVAKRNKGPAEYAEFKILCKLGSPPLTESHHEK